MVSFRSTLCLLFFFIIGLVTGDRTTAPPILMNLPLRFVTTQDYLLGAFNSAIFTADIDCPHLINSSLEVCAELPLNWQWDPFRGYVYMNIFNDTKDINDLSKALKSTGRPRSGGKTPVPCLQIDLWPGGSLFLRVDANNYEPIQYTVSVSINSSTSVQRQLKNGNNVIVPGKTKMSRPENAGTQIVTLTPVVSVPQTMTLEFDQDITFVLDLCLNHYQPDLNMSSSILATSGTFTQYICSQSLPCLPDSPDVICSANTPLPVSECNTSLKDKPQQVFVTIHAAGGDLNNSTKKYVGELTYGASFQIIL